MNHTCPDCAASRQISKAQASRIANGLRSGRCVPCAAIRRTRPEIDRFNENIVVVESGCWEWTGLLSTSGYGNFSVKRGRAHAQQAHRFIWEHIHGQPVPDGLEVDHLCFNRKCANPAHLEAVTPAENVRRWRDHVRARTHCRHGHSMTGANLYIDPRRGSHCCRRCRADREQLRRVALATRAAITIEATA